MKRRNRANDLLTPIGRRLDEKGEFDPSGIKDARERILSSIVRRRGQPAFRRNLLRAYKGRCAVTGCEVQDVLEACHIVSYKGSKTNDTRNGLLLRADLHTLFDLGLVAVDAATMRLLVSPKLTGTPYDDYRGKRIMVPDDRASWPSKNSLEQHQSESGLVPED
jgi:putative restriction endonuclease